GDEFLVGLRIEVLELLPGMLLVVRQIEVGPVVNSLELVPAERELVLDVVGVLGVMRQLIRTVLMPTQFLVPNPEPLDPIHPFRAPELEPLGLTPRLHEKLHFHLLEFARPENEVPGRDLVAECLPDLCDPEGNLLAGG